MIEYHELPEWIPGRLLSSSDDLDWAGVGYRQYQYGPRQVDVPAMSDFLVIEYLAGGTHLERRAGGKWQDADCGPGDLTLLTRSRPSSWKWDGDVLVRHAYLSGDFLIRVADEVLDRPVGSVDFADELSVRSPAISACMRALADEAQQPILGGSLFADAIGTQMAIHLLRNHVSIEFPEDVHRFAFSIRDMKVIEDAITSSLENPPSLDALASLVGLGRWSFSQRFKATYDMGLPQFVLQQKVECARRLVEGSRDPLKMVAFRAGFSDQAHMTRAFSRFGLASPSSIRKSLAL
ncbi:MAG: AraC family transcriptional regulator [Pseudomonadota bacterium]